MYDGPTEYIANQENSQLRDTQLLLLHTSKRPRQDVWDTAPDPEELVADLNLPLTPVLDPGDDENEADDEPQTIHYTNGDLKASKLKRLGVIKH